VLSPLLWIGLGVAALVLTALLYLRRRREQPRPEEITGRWDQLDSERADDDVGEPTARMSRPTREERIVVEERGAKRPAVANEDNGGPRPAGPARAASPTVASGPADDTLSNRAVINVDHAEAVAEADFHMAYGLYDQAAEIVQKALEAAPHRRDLKLKLLEVFFVWGNKDSFLEAAQDLRNEIGEGADADWDKVVIMGRQICPGERLFTDATVAPGASVDVDLEPGDLALDLALDAGDLPLDLALDAAAESSASASRSDVAVDFDLEASDDRRDSKAGPAKRVARPAAGDFGTSLDIGAQTAASLEAALFTGDEEEDTVDGTDTDGGSDALAVTQESPTIERPRAAALDLSMGAPTVETPTLETPAAVSAPGEIVETPFGRGDPLIGEKAALAAGRNSAEFTAEIDLDDLGLELEDIEGGPQDLSDLPTASGRESDTREQPVIRLDDEPLAASGVTKVLSDSEVEDDDFEQSRTSIVSQDGEATTRFPFGGTLAGPEGLAGRLEDGDDWGSTSLVRALKGTDGLDLDLADLAQALHGAEAVEQPRASSFSRDVFGDGNTPLDLDLDVGSDPLLTDEDPTGTEPPRPLDPQTMTEIGTKLDLARAYIDMGDPEGARTILEEVLDEGDPTQRQEAQSLIDVLRA